MKKRSKRFSKLKEESKKIKNNLINDILPIIKKETSTKFDETIDVNMRVNLKSTKSNFNLRTIVNFPNGTGKKIKIAVICEDSKLNEAKKSGADLFGSSDLISKIENGDMNFDKLISTPAMMIKVSKLGKTLGPKGLMPNPKLGTVTNDIILTVKLMKSGQIELKNDKDGNIGAIIGKKSFASEKLIENFNSLVEILQKEKPSNTKGNFFLSTFISSTMGPSYKLKVKGLN